MPNGEENGGGLNVPVAGGGKVDEALRALLKVISETPGAVGDFQIKLNTSSSALREEPGLDFTAGSYIRRVLPDPNNPGTNMIILAFIPDDPDPQVGIEFDTKNHPDPGDKATWMKLLGDPQGIDIDDGVINLRMDKTVNRFMVTWLPASTGVQPIWRSHVKPEEGSPVPPTVDLAAFLTCMDQNADLPAPVRLSQCLPSL